MIPKEPHDTQLHTAQARKLCTEADVRERESKPILYTKDRHDMETSTSARISTINPDGPTEQTLFIDSTDTYERYRARIPHVVIDNDDSYVHKPNVPTDGEYVCSTKVSTDGEYTVNPTASPDGRVVIHLQSTY